jgi:hypothetical protein
MNGSFRNHLFGTALLACGALTVSALTMPAASAASLYAPWPNGPSQSAKFFPIIAWYQNPAVAGHSGAYPTIAAAAAGEGMNTFLGLGNWPESFGADQGELEAIKANNLFVVGGINTPSTENSSAQSVASVLSLASKLGASKNVIGYNAGDESTCSPNTMQAVPGIVKGINGYDSTRIVAYNQTAWMLAPQWLGACESQAVTALQSISVGSFDLYPATNAWYAQDFNFPKGDFQSVPNDGLWLQGVATTALIHNARPGQPTWVFVEAGGDNLGFSSQNSSFSGGVTAGSTTLTNASGWSSFTSTWIGLGVSGSGIPGGAKITSIIDATHATISAAATATSAHESISVTGGAGAGTDCVASANLCVVNGNEYRPTPVQVNAEVWMSLINGANGIEYFCHDSSSDSFCMGDQTGGAAAAQTQTNLTAIDKTVLRFAPELNAPTSGICSMEQMNYTNNSFSVSTSCANGILTMATSNAAVPGMAMTKTYGGATYLFTQSDRRSTAGASFTYTLTGLAGKTAKVIYDSDQQYDAAHSAHGKTFAVSSSGQFSDVLGQNHDDYQVKIYLIK